MPEFVPQETQDETDQLTHTHTETGRLVIFNQSNALERISGSPVEIKR